MAGNRYLERNSSGNLHERSGVQTSAGAGDANKLVALNASGVLDSSVVVAVTSVAQALSGLSSFITVSGSPITTSGTITLTASCATGDLIYGSATNVFSKLTVGGTNQLLAVTSGLPSYLNGWVGTGAITASTTLTVNSPTLNTIDSTAGAVVVTLPSAAGSAGKALVLKKIAGTNATSITRADANTIDGLTTINFTSDIQNQSIILESDGTTTWRVVSPLGSGLLSNARFTSTNQTITAGGSLTLLHLLGVSPGRIWYDLVNVTAELGYTTGQRVSAQTVTGKNGAGPAMAIVPDATNLNIRFNNGSPVFQICNFTTGAQVNITNANWTVRFFAEP